jgi:hypothetical protein
MPRRLRLFAKAIQVGDTPFDFGNPVGSIEV